MERSKNAKVSQVGLVLSWGLKPCLLKQEKSMNYEFGSKNILVLNGGE